MSEFWFWMLLLHFPLLLILWITGSDFLMWNRFMFGDELLLVRCIHNSTTGFNLLIFCGRCSHFSCGEQITGMSLSSPVNATRDILQWYRRVIFQGDLTILNRDWTSRHLGQRLKQNRLIHSYSQRLVSQQLREQAETKSARTPSDATTQPDLTNSLGTPPLPTATE